MAASIHGILAAVTAEHGGRLAIVDGALRLTWHQLAARVLCLADALAPFIGRGAPLAFCAANSAAALEYLLAASALGAMFVPLNFRWTDAELAEALADCGARVLVVDDVERLEALSRLFTDVSVLPEPASRATSLPKVALELAILAPPPHATEPPGTTDAAPIARASRPPAPRQPQLPPFGCARAAVHHAQLLAADAPGLSSGAAGAGRAAGRGDEVAWLVYAQLCSRCHSSSWSSALLLTLRLP